MSGDLDALLAWGDALAGHLKNQPTNGFSRQALADNAAAAEAITNLVAALRSERARADFHCQRADDLAKLDPGRMAVLAAAETRHNDH